MWRSESEEGEVYCEDCSSTAFAAAAVDEGAARGGGGVVGFGEDEVEDTVGLEGGWGVVVCGWDEGVTDWGAWGEPGS